MPLDASNPIAQAAEDALGYTSGPPIERARILILNERDPLHPQAGGAETHVAEIFSRLTTRGHTVTHYASRFANCASTQDIDGIRIERLGPLPLYYAQALWRARQQTRAGQFDVVVECLNKVPFLSPLYSAVPVVALCHHLFGEIAFQQVAWPIAASVWALEKMIPLCYGSAQFLTISESTRNDLIRRGVAAQRIQVSHPGIAPVHQEAVPIQERAPDIIYVGRLEPYKRVDLLLHAMAKLKPRFPRSQLFIVGRGSARAALEETTRKLDIADLTHFCGFTDDAERDRLLGRARVCVCPSEKEGWGLTVVEANALGTPVVAANADGLRDSVQEGETGFLVDRGDVNGFVDRIARLLEDPELAADMSTKALAWSRQFDWERAADDMEQLIVQRRVGR